MAKMMVKRIGVLSVAKWFALLSMLVGSFMGILYSYSYGEGRIGTILYYLISSPIINGAIGFIATLIGGLIYNALAESIGGVILELGDTTPLMPPPPPKF